MNDKSEFAYIGLGSNMGDRLKFLTDAAALLKNTEGIKLEAVSPVYETSPVGYFDQPDFLNCAVKISTALPPQELLRECMRIENELDRKRTIRWGPRTVDLDILFYGSMIIDEENLTIPHPQIQGRGFVLFPLMDLAPNLMHPVFKKSIAELFKEYKANGKNNDAIKLFGKIEVVSSSDNG